MSHNALVCAVGLLLFLETEHNFEHNTIDNRALLSMIILTLQWHNKRKKVALLE